MQLIALTLLLPDEILIRFRWRSVFKHMIPSLKSCLILATLHCSPSDQTVTWWAEKGVRLPAYGGSTTGEPGVRRKSCMPTARGAVTAQRICGQVARELSTVRRDVHNAPGVAS